MTGEPVKASFCPRFHRAAELVGRRWTGAIVRALLHGMRRFNELEAAIPGVSARMLTERLRELETEDVVVRTVTGEPPTRVEYHLTYKGRALGKVIDALDEWAHDWTEPQPGDLDHDAPAARKLTRR